MNREEAIQVLTDIKRIRSDEISEAIDMAIEALQAEYEDYEHATLVDIKEPLKVLVVRCKDCRYRNGKVNRKGFEVCDATGMDITDEDFCSYGERREPGK